MPENSSPAIDPLVIQSHKGPYQVTFDSLLAGLTDGLQPTEHLIIDKLVAELYADSLQAAIEAGSVLQIEATEANKSLEHIPEYILHLLENGARRNHTLVGVGGGIIQDIVCFLSATLFRGIPWRFYPTTLLAQADSCIGSKSSINVAGYKNQVGTFTPPQSVSISTAFLKTLSKADVYSGVGEIIKVHIIAGWDNFRTLAVDYPQLMADQNLMLTYIQQALAIKQIKIEADEFDQGERLVMNYGHTFGHAIESATNYAVPHGIGVSIGMDFANYAAWQLGFMTEDTYQELHQVIALNYTDFKGLVIPKTPFLNALSKDKKNVGSQITLILPREPGQISPERFSLDDGLRDICLDFLKMWHGDSN